MIAIAPTDLDWFAQLHDEPEHARINFWTPTPWNIKQLAIGDLFYFLLKAPIREIGGYGRFAGYENLTASEAWARYGRANGVQSLVGLVSRTSEYARRNSSQFNLQEDPTIGCILLDEPVYLDKSAYIVPEQVGISFPREVVKLKYFAVQNIVMPQMPSVSSQSFQLVDPGGKTYRPTRVNERPGQVAFRRAIMAAYGGRCAISGEACSEVLEAAHIQPYVNEESDDTRNGLALRTDLHRLFDAGLFTVDPELRVMVSSHLNSSTYRAFNGQSIRLPASRNEQPAPDALEFHRRFVFRP